MRTRRDFCPKEHQWFEDVCQTQILKKKKAFISKTINLQAFLACHNKCGGKLQPFIAFRRFPSKRMNQFHLFICLKLLKTPPSCRIFFTSPGKITFGVFRWWFKRRRQQKPWGFGYDLRFVWMSWCGRWSLRLPSGTLVLKSWNENHRENAGKTLGMGAP